MSTLHLRAGKWRVQFTHPTTRKRCTLRLGTYNKEAAEILHARISELIQSAETGLKPSEPTLDWLASIGSLLRQRLTMCGLTATGTTMREWTQRYINEQYAANVPYHTTFELEHARKHLLEVFPVDMDLRKFTRDDAIYFAKYITALGKSEIRIRAIRRAVVKMFDEAKRRGFIEANMFDLPMV